MSDGTLDGWNVERLWRDARGRDHWQHLAYCRSFSEALREQAKYAPPTHTRLKPAQRWVVLADGVLESFASKAQAQALRLDLAQKHGIASRLVEP